MNQTRLKELLDYHPETGVFVWKARVSRNVFAGDTAGCINSRGYACITIDGKQYFAHRLAWLYVYGLWPEHEIDHKNRKKADNRLSNIRDVDDFKQAANKQAEGVDFHKSSGKWRARIQFNGVRMELGAFHTKEEATSARIAKVRELHGEFVPV